MADDVQVISGGRAKVAARLCNFETGKSNLLRAHLVWLESNVGPALQQLQSPSVDIIGYASRRGSASFNEQLSRQRCSAVAAVISRFSTTSKILEVVEQPKGERDSGPDEKDNAGYFRAVEVFVMGAQPRPVAAPAPPPEPQLARGTEFKIRLIGHVGASPSIVGGDIAHFQIWDVHRQRAADFSYKGVHLTFGARIKPKLEVPGRTGSVLGPFVPFRTSRPVVLDTFSGFAELYQDPGIAVGDLQTPSSMYLTFGSSKLVDALAHVSPRMLKIPSDAGFGVSLPAVGMGQLSRVTSEIIFRGP